MIFLFYSALCLSLIVFQTTIVFYFPVFERCYDLLLVVVIYLGLHRPARESLPVILAAGFVMDNLSAGPFGIYLTVYFWLFAGIKSVIGTIEIRNSIFFLFIVAAAVAVENLLFLAVRAAAAEPGGILTDTASMLAGQVGWALFTGPVGLIGIEVLHRRFEFWRLEQKAQRSG
jgi:cell shape-determining protein MreD